MNFLLLGIDSFIACMAIGALVDRRSWVWLAALFAAADAVGFLIGMGKKKRAAQTDTWRDMRNLAYFGLCDSERKTKNFDAAIAYCTRALSYDATDPYAHYALGLCFAEKGNAQGSREMFAAARKHFQSMLEINKDMAEAEYARKNVKAIDDLLRGT